MLARQLCSRSCAALRCTTHRPARCRRTCAAPEARLRPGRAPVQRKHREGIVRESSETLDFLSSLGIDRVKCMLTFAKANEALFWDAQPGGAAVEEADEEVCLSLEQAQEAVAFLRELGVDALTLPDLIVAHPPLLAYDVETRLRPIAEYMASLGISGQRFVAALSVRPSLLGITASKHKLMVEYLISTDTDMEQIREYVLTTL